MNYSIDDKGAMIGTMSHFFKIVGSYPTDLKHHRKAPTIVALSDFFKTAGAADTGSNLGIVLRHL